GELLRPMKHSLSKSRPIGRLRSGRLRASVVIIGLLASAVGSAVLPVSTVYAYQYGSAVLADNPTAYLPVDEGTGSPNDSVDGHAGTWTGASSWAGSGPVPGASSWFHGTGATSIRVGSPSSVPSGPGSSVEMWFQTTTVDGPEWMLTLWANGGAKPEDLQLQGARAINIEGTTLSCGQSHDGQPQMLDVTWSASGTAVEYLDGAQCSSGTGASGTWSTCGVSIGSGANFQCCGDNRIGQDPTRAHTNIGQGCASHTCLYARAA